VDGAGNSAALTLPTPGGSNSLAGNKAIVVDTRYPTVVNVTSSVDNGTYVLGDVIPISVTFGENVTVSGTPQITLATGNTSNAVVNYTSGSGSSSLTFNYEVAQSHSSDDLDYLTSSSLVLNSGSILDLAGNPAVLTLAEPGADNSLGDNKDIVIDTALPAAISVTSTIADGTYKVGQSIGITVTFNEAVTVTGAPQLTLETGSSDAVANYAGGSGTTILTFNYTVAEGHSSSDLDCAGTDALALNSGTINNAVGNAATLTLPGAGQANSLAISKAIVIDGITPAVPQNLAATSASVTSITLNWTANSDSDLATYKVFGGNTAQPTNLLATIATGTETVTVSGLTVNTAYYYRIASVDAIGNESVPSSDLTWSIIPGCVDTYAGNTSNSANLDDGSCTGYPDNGNHSLSFNGTSNRLDLTRDAFSGETASLSAWFWQPTIQTLVIILEDLFIPRELPKHLLQIFQWGLSLKITS
jgi:hypothetical protein